MAGDTVPMYVHCEAPLDDPLLDPLLDDQQEPFEECPFEGWMDVVINANLDGEWTCPGCTYDHVVTNIDIHEYFGPDPDHQRDVRMDR